MKIKNKFSITLCFILMLISLTMLSGCSLLTRKATNADIYIDLSQEISFSINYKVKPNVDIDNLEIEFNYFDSNGTFLAYKTKNVGNVTKGQEITVSVSLTEFSLTDLFKIYSTQAKVIGGTVPIFS